MLRRRSPITSKWISGVRISLAWLEPCTAYDLNDQLNIADYFETLPPCRAVRLRLDSARVIDFDPLVEIGSPLVLLVFVA